jgi:hypothetical protein
MNSFEETLKYNRCLQDSFVKYYDNKQLKVDFGCEEDAYARESKIVRKKLIGFEVCRLAGIAYADIKCLLPLLSQSYPLERLFCLLVLITMSEGIPDFLSFSRTKALLVQSLSVKYEAKLIELNPKLKDALQDIKRAKGQEEEQEEVMMACAWNPYEFKSFLYPYQPESGV